MGKEEEDLDRAFDVILRDGGSIVEAIRTDGVKMKDFHVPSAFGEDSVGKSFAVEVLRSGWMKGFVDGHLETSFVYEEHERAGGDVLYRVCFCGSLASDSKQLIEDVVLDDFLLVDFPLQVGCYDDGRLPPPVIFLDFSHDELERPWIDDQLLFLVNEYAHQRLKELNQLWSTVQPDDLPEGLQEKLEDLRSERNLPGSVIAIDVEKVLASGSVVIGSPCPDLSDVPGEFKGPTGPLFEDYQEVNGKHELVVVETIVQDRVDSLTRIDRGLVRRLTREGYDKKDVHHNELVDVFTKPFTSVLGRVVVSVTPQEIAQYQLNQDTALGAAARNTLKVSVLANVAFKEKSFWERVIKHEGAFWSPAGHAHGPEPIKYENMFEI